MESQGQQNSGGGSGTETTGEGEDEEPSSSLNFAASNELLKSLLEDDGQIKSDAEGLDGANDIKKPCTGNDPETMLEQFRQQWKNELRKVSDNSPTGNSRDGSPSGHISSISQPTKNPPINANSDNVMPDTFEQASLLFQHGIDFERRGKMYDAVRCYRQALILVPDIEKRLLSSNSAGGGRTYAVVASEAVEGHSQYSDVDEQTQTATSLKLVEIFRHRLFITNGGRAFCTPADPSNEEGNCLVIGSEQPALHISEIPSEVLMNIFKWIVSSDLDMRQLEQLSMVCCGFYIAARDPELWRLACLKVWHGRLGSLDAEYPTWRQMFIERPHLWYHGVYISKITYIRHGEESFQDQFYRPWHLVVYYRYLRFFSDGTLLMLTTPEEPSTVVPGLKWRQPRFQGVLKGTYRLVGHDCVAGVLTRRCNVDSTSSPYTSGRQRVVKQPNDLMEHIFSLALNISSVKRRHHVQLTWSNYEVTSCYRNGQTSSSKFDLCDQNFPPMYFSRVKSYAAYSEQPL